MINRGVEPGDTVTSRTYRSARTTNPRPWHNLANAFNKQYWKDGAHYDRSQLGGLEAALAKFIGTTHLEYQHLYNQTLTPLAGQSYAAVIQAAGPATVTTQNGIDNSVVRSGYHYIGAGKRADTSTPGSEYATHVGLNRQLAPDLTQQQVDPTTLPGFSLPTGQNGLFALASTAANAPHKYLIETNALLTALKPATSSDYLLANLGHDPDIPEKPEAAATPDNPAPPLKRLGDGFYEQRLIQQAVLARTGLRYLDGMTSDDAMFKHLMNNALASKAALNLTLGTQLSSEQVAALTHDIVWMEYTVVNGESVLAPVLYLAHANNRLAPNGALIQASDLELITGTQLNNSGTLRASNAMRLRAGDNFINEGLTEAKDRLEVLAVNNVINRAGGIIKGPDVSLIAIKGDVLNERTVTTHTSSSGERAEQTSFVGSPARIEAPGALTFEAGQDVNIVGGVVDGGDIAIKAAKDVNIIAAQQVDSDLMKDSSDQTIKQHGSVVRADGNLRVEAGNDAFIGASTVEVEGALTAVVGRDMIISAQADERHSASKSRTVKAKSDQVQQVPTTLGAKTITLVAGQNMTIGASHLRATLQAYLYAAKDLNVPALQDHDYQLYDKKKKSGFGALEAKRDEVTRITHVGSTITTGADLLMRSGNDQLYQAATLDSGQALTLDSGGAITFEGVKDLVDESHTQTNNNAFWNASKGKGHTDETLRQTALIAQGSRAVNAVSGLQIDVKQINQQTVSQSIDAMVKADPNLAWIKAAQERGDVDWRQVKEIHESFKYDTAGLGPASQLIIAIAMAVAVGPTAMAAASGSGTFAAGAAGAVAAGAATKATVSAINNRGDLGAVLKDVTSAEAMQGYAISGLTAGLTAQYFNGWMGVKTNALGEITRAPLNTATGIMHFAGNQALQNTTSTLLGRALGKGGSANDALKATLFNTLAAVSFSAVGDYTQGVLDSGTPQKVFVHAMVGGLLSQVTGGDFKTGALAAGASELVSDKLAYLANGNKNLSTAASQIVGVLAASTQSNANSQSLDSASWVAKSGAEYNRHLHDDEDKWIRANAKQFAEQNGVTEQVARERLSQQSLKNVDYIWRALLSDGDDSAAKHFLSASGQTFITDLGEQQKLFTAEGNQLSRMEMYGDTANPQFYKDYVQSGISRQLSTGIATEIKDSGVGLAQDASKLYDAIKNNPGAALQGIWAGIKATPGTISDSYLNNGTAIGEGAAVAFNDEITAKLNDIYGRDIGAEQKTLLLLRTVSAAAGANGVAQAAGKLAEVAAKHIDDAVAKAAAKREAQGQAPDAPDLVTANTRVVGTDRPAANDPALPGPCCFAPGTLVATPAGPRAIERLQVGDLVWSKPEHGGEPFAAAILATHTRTDRPIYQLKLEGIGQSHGTDETLLVTPSHPFYVPAKSDFIPLSDLKQGDLLQSLADGATEGVSSQVTSVELFQPRGKTYNLTVDVGHTFYVGELKTWVHNTGPCGDDGRPVDVGDVAEPTEGAGKETPANSLIAKKGLQNDLAAQAGIPRDIARKPSSVWGKSIEDIKQSLAIDGATITPKPALSGTSGKAKAYAVEGHASVKEVQYHPGGGTHGPGDYYKIRLNDGTEIRVIDPSVKFSPGTITKNQRYLDPNGIRLKYEGGEWKPWE